MKIKFPEQEIRFRESQSKRKVLGMGAMEFNHNNTEVYKTVMGELSDNVKDITITNIMQPLGTALVTVNLEFFNHLMSKLDEEYMEEFDED
jgi:hypothetical protein